MTFIVMIIEEQELQVLWFTTRQIVDASDAAICVVVGALKSS
jgi:hypothetical protein